MAVIDEAASESLTSVQNENWEASMPWELRYSVTRVQASHARTMVGRHLESAGKW